MSFPLMAEVSGFADAGGGRRVRVRKKDDVCVYLKLVLSVFARIHLDLL